LFYGYKYIIPDVTIPNFFKRLKPDI